MKEISSPSPRFHNSPSLPRVGIVYHSAGEIILEDDGTPLPAVDFMVKYRFSYHTIIHPKDIVTHTVDWDKRAWHAGKSKFKEWEDLNDMFLGFCFLIQGTHSYGSYLKAIRDPENFTDFQYQAAQVLTRRAYGIYAKLKFENLTEHSIVSGPQVRPDPKPDPGPGFNLERLKKSILVNKAGTI